MKDYYIFKGGRIKRNQNTLQVIASDGQKNTLPIMDVKALHLFGVCDLNTPLIIFLNTKGIPIHFYNYYGNYAGSYYPREKMLSGLVTVKQSQHYLEPQKRIRIALEIIKTATQNMVSNLNYYKQKKKDIMPYIERIQSLLQTLPKYKKIDEIMGIEGNCKNIYYESFNVFLRKGFELEKRTRMPPRNMLNTLISFGNSMMYADTLTEIYHSQLDPTVSFLHEPGFRRFSLSLDISEIFKPVIVDKTIFKIINTKMISSDDFDDSLNGCYLSESGRKLFVQEYQNRMEKTIFVASMKKNVSYRRLLRLECYKLVKHIVEDIPYKGFRQK